MVVAHLDPELIVGQVGVDQIIRQLALPGDGVVLADLGHGAAQVDGEPAELPLDRHLAVQVALPSICEGRRAQGRGQGSSYQLP